MDRHKYRCETCNKYEDCPVMVRIRELEGGSPPFMSYAVIISEICGCYSHSDVPKTSDSYLPHIELPDER